jgi:protein TonB
MVLVSAICLVAFEWTSLPDETMEVTTSYGQVFDLEQAPVVPPEIQKPPPPPPSVDEVVFIEVPNENEVEEFKLEGLTEVGENSPIKIYLPKKTAKEDEEEVIDFPDLWPTFYKEDYKKTFPPYIGKHLEYPQNAADNGISGRVFVQFTVNSQGDVDDVIVVRGVDDELDNEAVRVIKESSPHWDAGIQNGIPVSVRFTFPIVFSLGLGN